MARKRLSRWPAKEVEDVKDVKEVEEKTGRAGVVRTYSDLLIYKQAYRLALDVSRLTKGFPRQEQYEMGRQVRRSSRSIAANIVEGWAKRNSAAEFKRHLMIAVGECAETKYWIELAVDEGIVEGKSVETIRSDYSKLGFMIHILWKEWRKF
jgi:four helix bundle protein